MQYQGIIFDLDGVLCSTDEYHYRAWKALADRLGIPFDRERNGLLRGVSRMDSLNIILEKSDKAYSQDEKNAMAEEKNTRYRQLLNQMSPADLSGDVKRTLDTLRARGLKLAIGSFEQEHAVHSGADGAGWVFRRGGGWKLHHALEAEPGGVFEGGGDAGLEAGAVRGGGGRPCRGGSCQSGRVCLRRHGGRQGGCARDVSSGEIVGLAGVCRVNAQNRNFRTRKPAIRSRKSAVQPRISLHEYRMEGSFEHEEE